MDNNVFHGLLESIKVSMLLRKKYMEILFFGGEGKFEDKEKQVNFDEASRFDFGDEDFIEGMVVFGDDDLVIKVIPKSTSPRVLETVVDDGVVENYPVEKSVESKVKFVATKHFFSLTDDMDEE
ncbi:hypothetical protein Scep_006863 [Stephania cephalantha]|uniref:Uncharacterized protein n=1 Tax=Stephania cephalantha TaxID=152367 RepID=A0AAP0PPG3_9MAGN